LLAWLETDDTALAVVIRKVRIPPNAEIQGEILADTPVVLQEEAPLRAEQVFEFTAALPERSCFTQHVVRQPIAGNLPAEREVAHHLERVVDLV
jgi:hypothetical protein